MVDAISMNLRPSGNMLCDCVADMGGEINLSVRAALNSTSSELRGCGHDDPPSTQLLKRISEKR